jgi:hypothetical protein
MHIRAGSDEFTDIRVTIVACFEVFDKRGLNGCAAFVSVGSCD